MSASSTTPVSGKIVARTASVHIDNVCNAFLHDCFRQFGIHIVALPGDAVSQLQTRKFEACVLRLYDPEAEKILNAARSSSSNRRMVVYGIARNAKEALRHSAYGVNAVLDEPLDRSSVMKVVRSTHLLVVNELRRYARVPVSSRAQIETPRGNAPVTTVEISSGGLSVRSSMALAAAGAVRVALSLPRSKPLVLRAFLCWERQGAEKIYGLRFDPTDPERAKIRNWIDQYLEIG
jgi:PilZ domain